MKAIVSRRNRARASRSSASRETPPITTSPSSGTSSPATRESRVDFPEPDGPVTTESRPGENVRRDERERHVLPEAARHAAQLDDGARGAVDVGEHERALAQRAERPELDDAVTRGHDRAVDDPGFAQRFLRDPHPAAAPDHDCRARHRALLADTAVADVDDAVGDRRRAGVVADDERRHAFLARELGEEGVDGGGARSSSSPVGSSAIRRRGRCASAAQRAIRCCSPPDSSPRERVGAVAQADPLEQACERARRSLLAHALQAERHRDQLLGAQLAGERAPVVLVGVPERAGPVLGETPLRQRAEIGAGDDDAAGARPLEPREHPHQRRLARPARPEHDADLALVDVEREPLQRRDAAVGSRVDAEQVAGLDEAHVPDSCARAGPRSSRNARRVASDDERRRDEQVGEAADRDDAEVERGLQRQVDGCGAGRDRDDARHEQREQRARDAPARTPAMPTTSARTRTMRRSSDGSAPWASRS